MPQNKPNSISEEGIFTLALVILTVGFLFVGFGFLIMTLSNPFFGSFVFWFGFVLEIVGVLVMLSLVRY